jgi:hypothetical protein
VTAFGRVALDGEEVPAPSNGDDWRLAWHPRPWRPEHEIPFRRTVPAPDLARYLWTEPGAEPIYARAAHEAGLTLPDGGDKR